MSKRNRNQTVQIKMRDKILELHDRCLPRKYTITSLHYIVSLLFFNQINPPHLHAHGQNMARELTKRILISSLPTSEYNLVAIPSIRILSFSSYTSVLYGRQLAITTVTP